MVIQLLTLLIVSLGGVSGWWLGRSMARRATAQAQLASRQSQAISELSIALLEALPFSADYLADSSLTAVRRHLHDDREGLRSFRNLLDDRLSDLLLAGIHRGVHKELEEIRLLTVQSEAQLRSVEQRLLASATAGESLPPGLVDAAVRQPSLQALKGHSVALNALLKHLGSLRSQHEREEAAALTAGNRVMVLGLLLAWAAGLLFAGRTSDRILRPLGMLEENVRRWVGREELAPIHMASFTRAPREIANLAASFQELGLRLNALVAQLEQQALSDSLTQVGNRRRFDLTLHDEWARLRLHGMPMSLLMIDVDHFKAYNDTYGHGQGDRCLIAVAAAIRDQGQRSSDLTCRIGGEEFALLLPETELEEARGIAEQTWLAVQRLSLPHRGLGEGGQLSVSIGVATAYPALEPDPLSLQLRADAALYRRKQQLGRNGVSVESCPPEAFTPVTHGREDPPDASGNCIPGGPGRLAD